MSAVLDPGATVDARFCVTMFYLFAIIRSRRESFAESSPHELADAHVVDVADGASEIAAEEVHEVKAEARSSRDFSRELGDFFDGLDPVAYAQEAPPVDDESDDETKTPS